MRFPPPRCVLLPALAMACACAGGKPNPGLDGQPPRDAYVWPDVPPLDSYQPDPDVLPPDLLPPDLLPDLGADTLAPDSHQPCPDSYEPNESCAAARSLGSVKEGSWVTKTATIDPSGDVDWYSASGEEESHFCLPGTNQTYYFKVKLSVPTGRELRVCVNKDSCTGAATCADNAGSPGPKDLEVKYKVDGTCSLNDDTDAKILVEALDGKGGCTAYTIAFNYND